MTGPRFVAVVLLASIAGLLVFAGVVAVLRATGG